MVNLSTAAAAQVSQSIVKTQAQGLSLRIAAMVQPDGRFHYAIGFDERVGDDDLCCQSEGVTLVVAADMVELVSGMTIDYVELEPGKPEFIFLNPNDPEFVPPQAI